MLQPFVQQGRPDAGPITMAESRENLTVLLVDVCDSTRLYESMGDEAAFREVRGCLDLFEKAVAANDGEVAKAVGSLWEAAMKEHGERSDFTELAKTVEKRAGVQMRAKKK